MTFQLQKAPFQLQRLLFSVHITIRSTANQSVYFLFIVELKLQHLMLTSTDARCSFTMLPNNFLLEQGAPEVSASEPDLWSRWTELSRSWAVCGGPRASSGATTAGTAGGRSIGKRARPPSMPEAAAAATGGRAAWTAPTGRVGHARRQIWRRPKHRHPK